MSERARRETTTRTPDLLLRLRPGQFEEIFQVPRHDPPCFHVSHSFVNGVFDCAELPGLRQQVGGGGLLHFLRQQFQGFDSFFDG